MYYLDQTRLEQVEALHDHLRALAHLLNADQVAVVAVAVNADGDLTTQ